MFSRRFPRTISRETSYEIVRLEGTMLKSPSQMTPKTNPMRRSDSSLWVLIISFAVLKAVAGIPIESSSFAEFSYGLDVFGEDFVYLPSNISCVSYSGVGCPLPMMCGTRNRCVCCKELANATRNGTLLCDLRWIHDGNPVCTAIHCEDTPYAFNGRACHLENETCRIAQLWNKDDPLKKVKRRCVPNNTTTPPSESPGTSKPFPWVAILGISVGIIGFVMVMILLFLRRRRRLGKKRQTKLHPRPVLSFDQNDTRLKRLPLSKSALGKVHRQKYKLRNACRAIRDCNIRGGLRRDWKEIAEDDLNYPHDEILAVDNEEHTKSINPFEVIVFDYLSRRGRSQAVEAIMHLRHSVLTRFEADEEENCICLLTEVIREINPTVNLTMNEVDGSPCPSRSPSQSSNEESHSRPSSSENDPTVNLMNGQVVQSGNEVDGSPCPSRSPSRSSNEESQEINSHPSPPSPSEPTVNLMNGQVIQNGNEVDGSPRPSRSPNPSSELDHPSPSPSASPSPRSSPARETPV